jgi:hypothetical protein
MYGFCLIGADGRAWLARDPFGIKPLYIMEHAGGLAFASEPRAFFRAGLMRAELDEAAARELLAFNYALGPAFKGLRRLAPGEVAEVRDGRIVSLKRTAALPLSSPIHGRGGPSAEQSEEPMVEGATSSSSASLAPSTTRSVASGPPPPLRVGGKEKRPGDRSPGRLLWSIGRYWAASTASSSRATMLVILIIGFTAGPEVSL